MSVLLAGAAAILFAAGTWLLLQRRLSRIIIGIGLLGHGANLLLLISGGGRGAPPLIGTREPGDGAFADPLPQAMALTAIVITFGVTAFLLALGYRSWQITHDDVVEDDVEDRLVARRRETEADVADEIEAHPEREADDLDDLDAHDGLDPPESPSGAPGAARPNGTPAGGPQPEAGG